MLLYVIPFILLLVVAIVLKKREDANKENTSSNASAKKNNNKKTAKKNVARTARSTTSQGQTAVVKEEVVITQTAKPLSPELKANIEKLISDKNYSSAEAKINQALNQDNAQHELYLYLIDIHLAQKDEFAFNQLINHIRSLGLDEIVVKSKEKQSSTQAKTENSIESIAFEPVTSNTSESKSNHAAFDALIDHTQTTPEHSTEPQTSNNVLEFDTSIDAERQNDSLQEQVQPLEFNLDSITQKDTTPTADFSFEAPAPTEEKKAENIAPLEFSFTQAETATPVVNDKPAEEIATEFKLDFAEPIATPTVEEETTVTHPNELEFKFTPNEEAETQPTFSFDLDQKTEQTEVVVPALNLEATPSTAETDQTVDSSDPLVQSFPELAQVDEIQLDLDLAQQYIDLGAYASARELLSQNESKYTSEQRQLSQTLLNQIAS
ncbi:hypothetical protein [Acinetobacter piscicola]|uniref:hypothetical protein n=1 Tax=Acinetobacter piscicola TaxID=2006115 RepID=UPI000B7D8675|nr:hypothetical protein [Acinetobacter piscicola]